MPLNLQNAVLPISIITHFQLSEMDPWSNPMSTCETDPYLKYVKNLETGNVQWIIKKNELENVMVRINLLERSLKFTCEIES